MSEVTKDDLLRIAEDHARRVMVGGAEQITPLCHAIRSTGEQIVFATPWRNNREKQMAIEALRALMREGEIIRYMMICEAWMATAPGGFDPETDNLPGPVEEMPNRVEIVVACAVDRAGGVTRIWETKRDDRGACADLLRITTPGETFVSPFLEMLPRLDA